MHIMDVVIGHNSSVEHMLKIVILRDNTSDEHFLISCACEHTRYSILGSVVFQLKLVATY